MKVDWCYQHETSLDKCEKQHTLPNLRAYQDEQGREIGRLRAENDRLSVEREKFLEKWEHYQEQAAQAEAQLAKVVEAAELLFGNVTFAHQSHVGYEGRLSDLRRALAAAQAEVKP